MQYLDNNINKKNTMEEYINQVVQYCSENGINTYEEIRSFIFNDIWKSYKNKAPRGKLEAIADDIAESVALRMGVSETGKNVVNINEGQLKSIVTESVKRMLMELDLNGYMDDLNTMNGDDFFKVSNDYSGNYEELIKEEMTNLTDLEEKVPEWIKPEIHSMVVKMESILNQCQRNREFDGM